MIDKMSLPPGSSPDFHISHRMICFSRSQDAFATILCSHDLDASINVWLGALGPYFAYPYETLRFITQVQVDAIAKDVLRSTLFSQSQKDDMVEDIQVWPRA